jgi:1-acyl-sn-glycerol-3-phosphate acyltransferase
MQWIRSLATNLKGLICSLLFAINMIVVSSLTLLGALICYLLPTRRWRLYALSHAAQIPDLWTALNRVILNISLYKKIVIQGNADLNRKNWYLIISNHQTWLDIPMVCMALNRKVPLVKFFMKKELLWSLPVAGVAAYLLGYPFMKRHTRAEIRKNPKLKNKDLETTHKACQKFLEHPSCVMNFAEGTRYTKTKSAKQKSPYQHLLKPKAAGCAIVTNELKSKLSGIINITINYVADDFNLWHLLCGRVEKIQLCYELLPVTDSLIGDYYSDREFRASYQRWINERWAEKDQLLGTLKNDAKPHSHCHSQ